jgi:MerR family transcriptional regulator, light-induced transcriptional regulator
MREKHTEWPDLEHYADIPLFNTRAVAQQTGIAAPTLRAWERRYLILSPQRAQNDYRLYSERDIAIIRWLKAHIDEGMSISQAIALFRHREVEQNQLHQRTSLSQREISPTSYDMHIVQERLLEAFTRLDEDTASRLMASVLAIYPLEQVCTQLVTPALWEIGRLWEQGLISVSIEHFASAFFHGLLMNLFHVTPINNADPLVIICSAPGEEHELAPLMLSLLLRRAGLHVAYLGQSIETAGLMQTARQLSPALICVSVTILSVLEAVIELGQKLQELPPPRPSFIFGGQAFIQHAELIAQVPGVYLDGDMQTIIPQLRRMALEHVEKGIP